MDRLMKLAPLLVVIQFALRFLQDKTHIAWLPEQI